MPRSLNVAAISLNQTPLDWDGNRRRIEQSLERARASGAHLALLPELCITGYGCEDVFLAPATSARALAQLQTIAPATAGLVAVIGLPIATEFGQLNAAAVVVDGTIRGFVAKQFLAREGLHYEPRWFTPCPRSGRTMIAVGGGEVPAGDLTFRIGGVAIGMEICEDAWAGADRPAATFAERGVGLVLNPSASHFAIGKLTDRIDLIEAGSRMSGAPYVYTNLVGNEAGRAIYDGGALFAAGGELIGRSPRLGFADVVIDVATLEVATTDADINPGQVAIEHDWGERPSVAPPAPAPWDTSSERAHEEFGRAVALALFDYLRKCGASGYVVSLSGGADSCATLCLCALMVQLGVRELGADGFRAALPRVDLPAGDDHTALTAALVTAIYQATRNSSDRTANAARSIAAGVGATFHHVSVDGIVEAYRGLAESIEQRPLDWERDDLALQNIQARSRAPMAWLVANLRGAVLLSTSNRSEASVGYATMDGDTSGGLCPIAGIDKVTLRAWLTWMRDHGPDGIGPIPEITGSIELAPTAELRPPGDEQTDEADLMPYPILDHIERLAIRDRMAPLEVFKSMYEEVDASPLQLAEWIDRFFRLWCANQWKRERFAPSLHVDDQSVDPKTWCRFPILSGGFRTELAELATYAESLT